MRTGGREKGLGTNIFPRTFPRYSFGYSTYYPDIPLVIHSDITQSFSGHSQPQGITLVWAPPPRMVNPALNMAVSKRVEFNDVTAL